MLQVNAYRGDPVIMNPAGASRETEDQSLNCRISEMVKDPMFKVFLKTEGVLEDVEKKGKIQLNPRTLGCSHSTWKTGPIVGLKEERDSGKEGIVSTDSHSSFSILPKIPKKKNPC